MVMTSRSVNAFAFFFPSTVPLPVTFSAVWYGRLARRLDVPGISHIPALTCYLRYLQRRLRFLLCFIAAAVTPPRLSLTLTGGCGFVGSCGRLQAVPPALPAALYCLCICRTLL